MMEGRDLIDQRVEKFQAIQALGHAPYPHSFPVSFTVGRLVEEFGARTADELEREQVFVKTAGRLMAIRGHGKASFGHVGGDGTRVQVYVREDRVGEENYALFRLLDIGDIIGVEGTLARTRTGELTVFCDRIHFLAKSFLPLPEKWHGLADVETRYRQRYLDLVANPEIREIFIRRSRLIAEMRRFLETQGYLEVETPMMQPLPGGAMARPFQTYHEALGIPLYLRIAPELYLKRLVVGGFDRVFEINRNFRNEGISTQHNPEFTMLEFYQAYSDYTDLMDLTEEMLKSVVPNVSGSLKVEFQNQCIDFGRFTRMSVIEAVQAFWPAPSIPKAEELCDRDSLARLLDSLGIGGDRSEGWGKLLGRLFEVVAEEKLIQPTFICDFPVELSPLSKQKASDPRFVERFELFVGGLELANAYSELNDPAEQRRRFEEQARERARGDEEAHEMDEDYIRALSYGMPPTAGEGIGIDRLAMVLTNSSSIREVILFPHLRPQSSQT